MTVLKQFRDTIPLLLEMYQSRLDSDEKVVVAKCQEFFNKHNIDELSNEDQSALLYEKECFDLFVKFRTICKNHQRAGEAQPVQKTIDDNNITRITGTSEDQLEHPRGRITNMARINWRSY